MSFVYPIDICLGCNTTVTLQKNSLREDVELSFGVFTYRDLADLSKEIRDTRIKGITTNKEVISEQAAGILIAKLSIASNEELEILLYNPMYRLWCLKKTFAKCPENKGKLGTKELEDVLLHSEIDKISERVLINSGFLEPIKLNTENPQ